MKRASKRVSQTIVFCRKKETRKKDRVINKSNQLNN